MAKQLERAYTTYNRKYFNGILPKIPVHWSEVIGSDREVQAYGWFHPDHGLDGTILIAAELKKHWSLWRMTLLHEMAHVKLREHPEEIASSSETHSRIWQKEMRRLAAQGAFNELW